MGGLFLEGLRRRWVFMGWGRRLDWQVPPSEPNDDRLAGRVWRIEILASCNISSRFSL